MPRSFCRRRLRNSGHSRNFSFWLPSLKSATLSIGLFHEMSVRKKILTGLVILAVLGGPHVGPSPSARIPDPIIDGKQLSYWLGTYQIPGSIPSTRVQVERVQADSAVCEAGTNAIPLPLWYISAHDSTFRLKLLGLAAKQHIIRFHLEYARNRRFQAECGFQALGAEGSNAVPELIRICNMNNSSPDYFIIETFGCIGPGAEAAIPLVLKAATNSNQVLRTLAIRSLGQMRACNLKKSVPVLLTGAAGGPYRALDKTDRVAKSPRFRPAGQRGGCRTH